MSLTIMLRVESRVLPSVETADRLREEYLNPSAQQMYIRLLKGGEFLNPQRKLQGKDIRGLNHFPEEPYDTLQDKWREARSKVNTTIEGWAKVAAKATKGLIATSDQATATLLKEAFSGWGVPMGQEQQPEAIANGFETTFYQTYCGDNKEQGMSSLARQLINTFGEKHNIDHLNYGISDVERDVLLVLDGMQGWLTRFYGSEGMQKAFSACVKAELAAYARRLTRVNKSVWGIDLLDEHVEVLRTFVPKVTEEASAGVDEAARTTKEPLQQPLPIPQPLEAQPLEEPDAVQAETADKPVQTPPAQPPKKLADIFRARSAAAAPAAAEPVPPGALQTAPRLEPNPAPVAPTAATSKAGVVVGVLEKDDTGVSDPLAVSNPSGEVDKASLAGGDDGQVAPKTIDIDSLIDPDLLARLFSQDSSGTGIQERSPEDLRVEAEERITTEHRKLGQFFAIRSQLLGIVSDMREGKNTRVDLGEVHDVLGGSLGELATAISDLSAKTVTLAQESERVNELIEHSTFLEGTTLDVTNFCLIASSEMRSTMERTLRKRFGEEVVLPEMDNRIRLEADEVQPFVMAVLSKLGVEEHMLPNYRDWIEHMSNLPLFGDQMIYLLAEQSQLREVYEEVWRESLERKLARLRGEITDEMIPSGRRTHAADEQGEEEPESPFGLPPLAHSDVDGDPNEILPFVT